jgi:hypothetical protein
MSVTTPQHPSSYRRTLFPFSSHPCSIQGCQNGRVHCVFKVMMNLYSPYVRAYAMITLNVKLVYSDYLSAWFSRDIIFIFLAKNRFPNSGFPQFINDSAGMSP